MSSTWFPSFGFSLPSLSPSVSLQKRFISFVLKRSLGHLVKPGQLDAHQIDAQIGDGCVEVKDLELDSNAVNALLGSLPVELVSGSLALVSAHIPWPNPFSSKLGLSLSKLRVVLRVSDPNQRTSVDDISHSVANAAEEFLHDELSKKEENELRDSIRLDESYSGALPGGFESTKTGDKMTVMGEDADVEGGSLFSGLLDTLLARFEFTASDINVTLVHSDLSRLVLRISQISYNSTISSPSISTGQDVSEVKGVRVLQVEGITVLLIDKGATNSSRASTSRGNSRGQATENSDSEMDEATQLSMSQSLASLPLPPARPASPSLSTISSASCSSSLYESAAGENVDSAPQSSPHTAPYIPGEHLEETLLRFSDPITIRLEKTKDASSSDSPPKSDPQKEEVEVSPKPFREAMKLNFSTGHVVMALRPKHIQVLLAFHASLSNRQNSSNCEEPETKTRKVKTFWDSVEITAHSKGVVMLLLTGMEDAPVDGDYIRRFFDRPLPPPRIAGGYMRTYIDSLSLWRPAASFMHHEGELKVNCSISDISILAFKALKYPANRAEVNLCLPILITDAGLAGSYDVVPKPMHQQNTETEKSNLLPSFAVIDWTSESNQRHGTSLRNWRHNHGRRPSGSPKSGVLGASASPALVLNIYEVKESLCMKTEIGQLHAFVDLSMANTVIALIDDLSFAFKDDFPSEVPSLMSSTFLKHPVRQTRGVEDQLAQQVLDDLDLSMNYMPGCTQATGASIHEGKEQSPPMAIDVEVQFIRIEVRVPPPKLQASRSGSFVVDIHGSRFSNNSLPDVGSPSTPTFDPELQEWFHNASNSHPLCFEMRRIVCAYGGLRQTKAHSFLSVGPITEFDARQTSTSPLIIFKGNDAADGKSPTSQKAMLVRLPSIYVVLDKPLLDGLQLWADDLSQWTERFTSGRISGASTQADVSRTTSLLGSRYFTQRAGSGSSEDTSIFQKRAKARGSEFVIKAIFGKVFVRLDSGFEKSTTFGFLDCSASDWDLLVEVKPEGRDELVMTLGISDISVLKDGFSIAPEYLMKKINADGARQAAVKLTFRSLAVPESVAKESKIKASLHGMQFTFASEPSWVQDLSLFFKPPPGAFESVVPSERTHVTVNLLDCSLLVSPPSSETSLLVTLDGVSAMTALVGDSEEKDIAVDVMELSAFLTNKQVPRGLESPRPIGSTNCMKLGYTLLANVQHLQLHVSLKPDIGSAQSLIEIEDMLLNVYLCADTISGIAELASDFQALFPQHEGTKTVEKSAQSKRRAPIGIMGSRTGLLQSVDEQAFRQQPVIGPLPDMIADDLPRNPDYLDSSFGAAAGLRVLDDEEDTFVEETSFEGGETIKMLHAPIEIIENYYETIVPSSLDFASEHGNSAVRVRAKGCDVHLFFHDGYDWDKTRKAIQEEVKRVKKRLSKIRQLLANGQSYDPNIDELNSVLFNSVYVGLDTDAESLEPDALIAAIDTELLDDDATSESSWQSFKPNRRRKSEGTVPAFHSIKLERSRSPSIEFSLTGLTVDFDQYAPDAKLASRLLFSIRNLQILDHMKSSTWRTFLTDMRTDSRGNIRESDSNMVRVELQTLTPFRDQVDQEARLKAKMLPLRLHVDQDALDFLKKFFAFKAAETKPSPPPENEIFFQQVEIFPVDIKLDYKPRRVDYRALKEGKTIELMNFFHFDGAEMTLRHITLKGITGWPRMFDTLNDLWTPDVKANQLVDVISGVSPIRSAVNVGSGVADLVLLPIAQYKKDGRIIRGLQKGTKSFVKSTAMEALRLGARLATGTQVVLEQAESILGGQSSGTMTVDAYSTSGEPLDVITEDDDAFSDDLISKYAEQPTNVREGVQTAYRTLSQNIKSAGQTILAVPMEVYERSGNEGPARAVIRAVPIAVLKPMIGASEAISKTLFGIHNTLDPQSQLDYEAKYKHR